MGNTDESAHGAPATVDDIAHRSRRETPYASALFKGVFIGSLFGAVLMPLSMIDPSPSPAWQPDFGTYIVAVIFGSFIGGVVAGFSAACALGLHVLIGRISPLLRAPSAALGAIVGVFLPACLLLGPRTALTLLDAWPWWVSALAASVLAVRLTKRFRT
ncbi:hypothetical protein [Arthrobacter castelli]|uniref:hypothetical protein n=1 Tax=Arthrobacter castelli TaxID=271431 RepID=UPI0012DF606B|nr:hypothetical protein [Arthrobacter castelli]